MRKASLLLAVLCAAVIAAVGASSALACAANVGSAAAGGFAVATVPPATPATTAPSPAVRSAGAATIVTFDRNPATPEVLRDSGSSPRASIALSRS